MNFHFSRCEAYKKQKTHSLPAKRNERPLASSIIKLGCTTGGSIWPTKTTFFAALFIFSASHWPRALIPFVYLNAHNLPLLKNVCVSSEKLIFWLISCLLFRTFLQVIKSTHPLMPAKFASIIGDSSKLATLVVLHFTPLKTSISGEVRCLTKNRLFYINLTGGKIVLPTFKNRDLHELRSLTLWTTATCISQKSILKISIIHNVFNEKPVVILTLSDAEPALLIIIAKKIKITRKNFFKAHWLSSARRHLPFFLFSIFKKRSYFAWSVNRTVILSTYYGILS